MFDDSPEIATSERVLIENNVRRALRVLNALVVEGYANPSDVEELRRFAPLLAGAPLDVLAWGVFEQVLLKHRRLVRGEPYRPMDTTG
jgi:hypothetical protein